MANSAALQIDYELLNLQGGLYDSLPPAVRLDAFISPAGAEEQLIDTLAPVAPCATPAAKAAHKAPSGALRTAGLIAVAAAVGVLGGASGWKLFATARASEQVAAAVAPNLDDGLT